MKLKKGGLIAAIILVIGLILFNRGEVKLVKQDGFTFSVVPSLPDAFEIRSTIHLKNPNLLSSTIKSVHEKFYLNDSLVGAVDNDLAQGIPGLKETEFPVMIRCTGLKALTTDDLPLLIKVTGEIEYQNLTGGGIIKVDVNDTISNLLK